MEMDENKDVVVNIEKLADILKSSEDKDNGILTKIILGPLNEVDLVSLNLSTVNL